MLRRITSDSPTVAHVLSKLSNGCCRLPFASGHAWHLYRATKLWRPSLLAALEADPITAPPMYFIPMDYATDVLHLTPSDIDRNAWALPLPQVTMSGNAGTAECEPRIMLPLEAFGLRTEDLPALEPKALPRDAQSALYFRREELVDNFLRGGRVMKSTNPFWIRSTHPSLGSVLQLRRGHEDAIVVSVTGTVYPSEWFSGIDEVRQKILRQPRRQLLTAQGGGGGDHDRTGKNAITDVHSANPIFKRWQESQAQDGSAGSRLSGEWISLCQAVSWNLTYRGQPITMSNLETVMREGTLVEVDQWTAYNADQLQVPGRLHLKISGGKFSAATTESMSM